jgi:uncharacterized Zn finger protein
MPRRKRSDFWGPWREDWPTSLSIEERQRRAAGNVAKLTKTAGRPLSPLVVGGRREIATTFWGQAWCENLERYSDFENRLPRGRSYLRSGSVLDLRIDAGVVNALVSGTAVYRVTIDVAAVAPGRWEAICRAVSGAIDSVVELLQGRLSKSVMARLCGTGAGLFPTPREITFKCSCPDAASMCKHIAAVLYGIGVRFDDDPALLFTLRQVHEQDLIARAEDASTLMKSGDASRRRGIDPAILGDVFGLDIAPVKRRATPRRRTRVT